MLILTRARARAQERGVGSDGDRVYFSRAACNK